MTEDQVREKLREACKEAGSQRAWGDLHGFSAPFITRVLTGLAKPSERMCRVLGLQKKTIYVALSE